MYVVTFALSLSLATNQIAGLPDDVSVPAPLRSQVSAQANWVGYVRAESYSPTGEMKDAGGRVIDVGIITFTVLSSWPKDKLKGKVEFAVVKQRLAVSPKKGSVYLVLGALASANAIPTIVSPTKMQGLFAKGAIRGSLLASVSLPQVKSPIYPERSTALGQYLRELGSQWASGRDAARSCLNGQFDPREDWNIEGKPAPDWFRTSFAESVEPLVAEAKGPERLRRYEILGWLSSLGKSGLSKEVLELRRVIDRDHPKEAANAIAYSLRKELTADESLGFLAEITSVNGKLQALGILTGLKTKKQGIALAKQLGLNARIDLELLNHLAFYANRSDLKPQTEYRRGVEVMLNRDSLLRIWRESPPDLVRLKG